MYRVNPLKRNVLITADEVIFHAPTEHTLDERTILQAIIIAEERIIRPALCFDFYEVLRNEKNREITALNKAQLELEINNSIQSNLLPGQTALQQQLVVGDVVNSSEFLSADNKLLWNEFLWKLTAEAVRFVAIPQNYASFTSEGIVHNNPVGGAINGGGASTPELRTAKWLIDKALFDTIDPLLEAMHAWVCNKGVYNLYCKPCDCNAKGISYERKAGILLGIYDEEEKKCGCR